MYQSPTATSGANGDPLDRVSNAYSSGATWYLIRGFFLVKTVYRSSITAQIRFFAKNFGSRHLEVPVGNGSLLAPTLQFRRLTRRKLPESIVGIDVAENMLKDAKKRFAKKPFVTIQRGDVAKLEFPDHHFDSINISNGLHCFPDPQIALREIARVLAVDGTVAINALLHPRGFAPSRWLANRVNAWAQRTGLLNAPFEAEDVRIMLRDLGLTIQEDRIHGNTIYITARKVSKIKS